MASQESASGTESRFLELDALRGIAAFWVMLGHYTIGVGRWLPGQADLVPAITPTTFDFSEPYAVHLFFMISGFVIMMTADRSQDLRGFVLSRVARLYPAYWCAVLISGTVCLLWPLPRHPISVPLILANMTMLQDYIGVAPVDAFYWSLTYEIGFYGLAGLVLLAGARRHVEVLAAGWVIASFLLLHLLPRTGLAVPWRIQAALALPYAGLFVAGLMFYRIQAAGLTAWRAAVLLLCFLRLTWFAGTLETTLVAIFFLVFAGCVARCMRVLRHPALVWLGGISYSLYLVHYHTGIRMQLAPHAIRFPPWLNLMSSTAMALIRAWAVRTWVEIPGGRFIRRHVPIWFPALAPARVAPR